MKATTALVVPFLPLAVGIATALVALPSAAQFTATPLVTYRAARPGRPWAPRWGSRPPSS